MWRLAGGWCLFYSLNESPSEKEGKFGEGGFFENVALALNESPSEKEGKFVLDPLRQDTDPPLNESPSEKEGK